MWPIKKSTIPRRKNGVLSKRSATSPPQQNTSDPQRTASPVLVLCFAGACGRVGEVAAVRVASSTCPRRKGINKTFEYIATCGSHSRYELTFTKEVRRYSPRNIGGQPPVLAHAGTRLYQTCRTST
eukprot:4869421-Amphidinium_carterae.1